MSLINVSLLGNKFVQDKHPNYIKIGNVVMGESPQFGYKSLQNKNISSLLNSQLADKNCVCILYHWKSGMAYIKSGFDLDNSSDSTIKNGFSTFIVKDKINQFYKIKPVTPAEWTVGHKYSVNDTVLYSQSTFICLNGHTSQSDWAPIYTCSLWKEINKTESKPTPVITPTPTPVITPTPTPVITPTPTGYPKKMCAPYFDAAAWPPYDIVQCCKDTGNKYFSAAFVIADSSGNAAMAHTSYTINHTKEPWFLDRITELRKLGGDVIISFGGAAGTELAIAIKDLNTLVKEYQKVIDIYSAKIVSFDIEGHSISDTVSVNHRNKAIAILQKNNPNLIVHYVLAVMPNGLTQDGTNLLKNAKLHNVKIDCMQIMLMDYGENNQEMGKAAINACKSTKSQLTSNGFVNCTIGACPMIGQNDTRNEVFTLDNAIELYNFIKKTDYIDLVTFWSTARDVDCNTVNLYASPSSSGIIQKKYDFLNIFKNI